MNNNVFFWLGKEGEFDEVDEQTFKTNQEQWKGARPQDFGDVDDNKIAITKNRYEELIESEKWLIALESAGVDNWVGFDFAREIFNEEE